jgi:hypothetical protein
MRDLNNPATMWLKAVLLLAIGVTSSILLLLEFGTLRGALLLGMAIWGICRAYYFAFYLIENYVDPAYRYSGLLSFVRYWVQRRRDGGGAV